MVRIALDEKKLTAFRVSLLARERRLREAMVAISYGDAANEKLNGHSI
jgi:hypothetical protein